MVARDKVTVGSLVRVRDAEGEAEFELVEPRLAGPFQEGCVTTDSPLGGALLGRRPGERVRFRAPGGIMAVTIVEVGTANA